MYASFLDLPVEGRHSRALHLKLFTVPSVWTTFYGVITFGDSSNLAASLLDMYRNRQCGEVLRGASLEGEIVRRLDSAVPLTAIRWNDMLGCMVMSLVIVEALA
jgi:hypothetical protein